MIGTLQHRPLQINRLAISVYANYDPTKTTALRNQFARAMKTRFDNLCKAIQIKVVDEDCFGLNESKIQFNANPMFAFPRSQDKVTGFMNWLDQQVKEGILEVKHYEQIGQSVDTAWTNMYVQDSYKRGVIRARYELDKAGFNIPTLEETGGVTMSMVTPFHMDRLGLLYGRVFSDLKGVTSTMDTQISRVLSQGIADGDNPRFLAKKLVSTINGTGVGELGITDTLGRFIPAGKRAEMIARTEIIRAHHQATIQEYKNWAVEGVIVQGEWLTAEDSRVCEKCKSLEGKVFTLSTIEGLIPLHPNCRCIALPKKVEEKTEEITIPKIEIPKPKVVEVPVKSPIPVKEPKVKAPVIPKPVEIPKVKVPDESIRVKGLKAAQETMFNYHVTDSQHQAILNYTGESYNAINGYYRGFRTKLADTTKETADLLDLFLKDAPKVEMVSYRGIVIDTMYDRETLAKFINLKTKDIYIDKAFMSTSYELDTASAFGDIGSNEQIKVLFTIEGKNGVLIEKLADDPKECEVLFQRNSKFEILNVSKNVKDNLVKIKMKEL